MLDKTVDFFRDGQYVATSAFSTKAKFQDLVAKYLQEKGYSRILIRQWEKGKEVKSHNITW